VPEAGGSLGTLSPRLGLALRGNIPDNVDDLWAAGENMVETFSWQLQIQCLALPGRNGSFTFV
jgi:hypothetical protein